jgi:hypothetical protein
MKGPFEVVPPKIAWAGGWIIDWRWSITVGQTSDRKGTKEWQLWKSDHGQDPARPRFNKSDEAALELLQLDIYRLVLKGPFLINEAFTFLAQRSELYPHLPAIRDLAVVGFTPPSWSSNDSSAPFHLPMLASPSTEILCLWDSGFLRQITCQVGIEVDFRNLECIPSARLQTLGIGWVGIPQSLSTTPDDVVDHLPTPSGVASWIASSSLSSCHIETAVKPSPNWGNDEKLGISRACSIYTVILRKEVSQERHRLSQAGGSQG